MIIHDLSRKVVRQKHCCHRQIYHGLLRSVEPLKLKGKCFGDGLHKSFHCKNAHDWISNRVPSSDSGLLCPCVCVCVRVRSRVIHFAVTLKSLLLVAGKSTKALSIGLHGKSKTTICKCLEVEGFCTSKHVAFTSRF